MVNLAVINERTVAKDEIQRIKDALEAVFKYTQEVNAHVFLNFKSPIDSLGVYDYLFFIEIPYRQGNYFRTQAKVYLNNIVFAIRKITDTSITEVKNGKIYTASGELDYEKQIVEESNALKQYIRNNLSGVQYVDLALYYSLEAPNCSSEGFWGNLLCNVPRNMYKLISKTVDDLKGEKAGTTCLSLEKGISLSDVIFSFIEATDARTNHGILTKKKIDAISTKEIGKQMQALYDAAGKKLEIVTGKAGTGKSLALLRFMYNHIQNHHCRLLTFNNLLVMDTKMALRNIGKFTPTNASISTLHKFFYDMYIHTPVCSLHMNEGQVNRLFDLCHRRVSNMVVLIEKYAEENGSSTDATAIFKYYEGKEMIINGDLKEMRYFAQYLSMQENWSLNELHHLAAQYEEKKRECFMQFYGQTAFLSGYRIIMEQLYLLFHNSDEFLEKFGEDLLKTPMSVRQSKEFKAKYEKLYDEFIEQCKEEFTKEHGVPDELFSQYIVEEEKIINEIKDENLAERLKEQREKTQDAVKSIKRKVCWSQYVLVDEAQDCANYEKELLLEIFGSSNIIIASGGKDQLIRTPIETHWDVSFRNRLDSEKVNLTHISHRQKGNVVEFINAFSKEFNLDTELSVPDSIKDTGRVIIDMRNGVQTQCMPTDIINNLRMYGADYGCTPYESMMMLFPNEGFTNVHNEGNLVTIDKNDTIAFDGEERTRSLAISLPNAIRILDCTVNGKSQLLKEVGHDKIRCLLYESCRGLEAWSVLCFGLDIFFAEKQACHAASDYADEVLGLFKDDLTQRRVQTDKYAALWLLMALTRAMDTLYISFTNPHSFFASQIVNIGLQLPFVEILQ